MTWKNLENNIETEPLMIFGGEWEWKRIPTAKGRVFSLKNLTFPEEIYIYWMQYPNTVEDDYNETVISNILKTGQLEINENPKPKGDVEMTSVEETLQKKEDTKIVEETKQTDNTNKNTSKAGTKAIDSKKLLSNLSNEFQRIRRS